MTHFREHNLRLEAASLINDKRSLGSGEEEWGGKPGAVIRAAVWQVAVRSWLGEARIQTGKVIKEGSLEEYIHS